MEQCALIAAMICFVLPGGEHHYVTSMKGTKLCLAAESIHGGGYYNIFYVTNLKSSIVGTLALSSDVKVEPCEPCAGKQDGECALQF